MLETLITPWPRQPLSFPYTTYNTAGSRKVHFHILLSILRCVRLATGFKVRDSLCDCTSVQKGVCVYVERAESGRPRRPGLVGVRCRRQTHPAWAANRGNALPCVFVEACPEVAVVIVVELLPFCPACCCCHLPRCSAMVPPLPGLWGEPATRTRFRVRIMWCWPRPDRHWSACRVKI